MSGPADLVAPMTAWLVLPGQGRQRCLVNLEYRSADPYAVSAVIHGHTPVRWTFAHDLLREGLVGDAGLGDVRFRHTRSGTANGVWMHLIGVGGDAWLRLPVDGCAEFLSRVTLAATAPGDPLPRTLEVELQHLLERG